VVGAKTAEKVSQRGHSCWRWQTCGVAGLGGKGMISMRVQAPNPYNTSITRTFFGAETVNLGQITESDVVVLGVPFDIAAASRPGARYAPAAIRDTSMDLRNYMDTSYEKELVNVDTGEWMRRASSGRLVDAGNVGVYPTNANKTADSVTAAVEMVVSSGGFPVIIGGDHYITYPSFRGFVQGFCKKHNLRRNEASFGYIQMDAHFDLASDSILFGQHYHGANAYLISQLESVDTHNMVWIGLRGYARPKQWDFAKKAGVTVYTAKQVREEGISNVVKQAAEVAAEGADTVYLSIDIDVVDFSDAPGTGAVTLGGLSDTELLEAVHILRDYDAIGAIDLMEVAPNLDPLGATQRLAAVVLLEFIAPRLFITGHDA